MTDAGLVDALVQKSKNKEPEIVMYGSKSLTDVAKKYQYKK